MNYQRRPMETAVATNIGITYITSILKQQVGRPKNTSKIPIIYIAGVADEASMPGVTHEILLADRLVRILTLLHRFLSLTSGNIILNFDRDGLEIIEPLDKNNVTDSTLFYLKIHARWIHYYYVEYPMSVKVAVADLLKILGAIKGPTHYVKLCISQNRDQLPVQIQAYVHASTTIDTYGLVTINGRRDQHYLHRPYFEYYPFIIAFEFNSFSLSKDNKNAVYKFTKRPDESFKIELICIEHHTIESTKVIGASCIQRDILGEDSLVVYVDADRFRKIFNSELVEKAAMLHLALHPSESIVIYSEHIYTNYAQQFHDTPQQSIKHNVNACTSIFVIPQREAP